MNRNSKYETALTWTPEGRRKVGRPKTTRRSTVENENAYWGGTAASGPEEDR